MRIEINKFMGMLPRIPYQRKPVEFAESATDANFEDENLKPVQALKDEAGALKNAGDVKTIFKTKSGLLLSFLEQASVVRTPISQDDYDRVYWTELGSKPQVAPNDIISGETSPNASYDLGVPIPTDKITIVENGNTQNEEDFADDETRFYTYTFVTGSGEEGAPAPLSDEITVLNPAATFDLTIPPVPTNNSDITHVRIYRSVTSLTTSDFMLVAEIDNATLTYTDNIATEQLGKLLDTSEFLPPIEDMQGLVNFGNGILAGFSGNTICFSEPYLPYAWPVKYQLTTEHNIVGLAVMDGGMLVVTEGYPYIAQGVSPDGIIPRKIELNEPCLSARSIVDMGTSVMYASPNGLVTVSANTYDVVTRAIMTKSQWEAYNPALIIGGQLDGQYFGFWGNESGGFVFDTKNGAFSKTNIQAQAVYTDLFNSQLLLVNLSGALKTLDSDNLSTYTWSKKFELNGRKTPSAIKFEFVTETACNLVFKVDGTQRLSTDVHAAANSQGVIRLPALRGNDYELVITGSSEIERIIIGNSVVEVSS